MKGPFAISIFFLAVFCTVTNSFGQVFKNKELQNLYKHRDFFRLRTQLIKKKNTLSPQERLYYSIVLNNAFNHCLLSNQQITFLRKSYPNKLTDQTQKDLLNIQA